MVALDPGYYHYEGCSCAHGMQMVWSNSSFGTLVMSCVSTEVSHALCED